MFTNRRLRQKLQQLIDEATKVGLPGVDINHAADFLAYNEYALCLDQVATQLYEYDIKINQPLYDLIFELTGLMKIEDSDYQYLKELLAE